MRKSEKRTTGEGASTKELFAEAIAGLHGLQLEMEKRRNRDRASRLMTGIFVAIQEIANRFAQVGPEFDSRSPVAVDDEDDNARENEPMSMAELFPQTMSAEEDQLDDAMRTVVDNYLYNYKSIEAVRARHYRECMLFMVRGCTQVDEIMKRVTSICRRVMPDAMAQFGMSQVDVSRKINQKRATVSAREQRVVEDPLRKNGTRGFRLLGGTKSDSHRENCSKAQMGNTNRRDSEKRKRGALKRPS